MKRVRRFLASMRMAITLLFVIVIVCIIGSFIPQGQLYSQYLARYGEGTARFITTLQLDRVFDAWWFAALTALLLINLLMCSLLRFPALLKQHRAGFSLDKRLKAGEAAFTLDAPAGSGGAVFKRLGFASVSQEDREGTPYQYAARNKMGLWGSWLSHLGVAVLVIGFSLGRFLAFEGSVYGVPGQTLALPGTHLEVTINSFDIDLRADYTVKQYTSSLTVTDKKTGQSRTGLSQVNAPLHAFGMDFLQNATGWAADLSVYQQDSLLERRVLCAGESLALESLPGEHQALTLVFHALYPDYVRTPSGPATKTPELINPAALFSLYYQGRLVDMNVAGIGFDITAGDYRFVLENPRHYTLIQAVRDPAAPITLTGGALMLIGLVLAFLLRPEELWLWEEAGRTRVSGRSLKGAVLYQKKVEDAVSRLNP